MYFVGIDLSGPSNVQDTALACMQQENGRLSLVHTHNGLADSEILALVDRWGERDRVVVGLDAPLSYNPGGGDRPGDKRLRQKLVAAGLRPGSVMTPTMTRMVYLTLRGVVLARGMQSGLAGLEIIETHPGGVLALHGAPLEAVLALKTSAASRRDLLRWLDKQGLAGTAAIPDPTDHLVAAAAAAFAAWRWHQGQSRWLEPAAPPLHPFDYAC